MDNKNRIKLMEVCGTHTMSIARHGLKKLFPENVEMLSGPGCPVCVTSDADIDLALEVARIKGVIVATFGDMLRVPGSTTSLEKERAEGADIRIVYSAMDALDIARSNPSKKVVFLGVGFETTSPTVAGAVKRAKKEKLNNFFVLPMFKTVPLALKMIAESEKSKINGFLLPGHVSAIIGSEPYEFLAKKYKIPCVIGGFEPEEILKSVEMLTNQIKNKIARVEIQYDNVVKKEGNAAAINILKEVFEECGSDWRGIGNIGSSGLTFNKKYKEFNAITQFKLKAKKTKDKKGCLCGKILLGQLSPADCRYFGKECTPLFPIGPCMVSSEGACAAYYKYGNP